MHCWALCMLPQAPAGGKAVKVSTQLTARKMLVPSELAFSALGTGHLQESLLFVIAAEAFSTV